MTTNKIDAIEFRLRELHDFTWLKRYGTAFWVIGRLMSFLQNGKGQMAGTA